MFKPTGSWVALPTPYDKNGKIDFGVFKEIIDRQIEYGTSELFVMGSAGEVTLLTPEERETIVKKVIKLTKGRIPVFFNASYTLTKDAVQFAKFAENEGADGLIFTAPPYLLPPQSAILEHLRACMRAVSVPVGVYNNPSRLGVELEVDTLVTLAKEMPNFIVDKEAVPSVAHLVEVKRQVGDKLNILCCDAPGYSIVLPTLAVGGNGTANIGGNIIPEEMALISRPWDSIEKVEESRNTYFKYYPLLKALYWFSNPIVIKAAYELLGLPLGGIRRPYPDLEVEYKEDLRQIMTDLGVIDKYRVN
ncbi:dihydrodipicolinate synthase family protein [Propionispira raffinosivorans]|uniref:dihydrodipicolinate synthase family protein n=1 Tax=Propionispira raffinosivorans TaxID=86959 RepID=UPI00037E35CF|nr:dihydrodipicolinate synthase family protein [Propionispira raffinosivorans]